MLTFLGITVYTSCLLFQGCYIKECFRRAGSIMFFVFLTLDYLIG